MKNSKLVAFSGILSALSIALLFLGSVVSIFAYIIPILSGFVLIASNSISKKSSWLIYISVSIISIFVMADKECPLTYIFFFGYYPIIKNNIEKIGKKITKILVKFFIFNAGIIVSQLICFYVFGIPFDDFLGKWGIVILLIMANVLFLLYDKMIKLIEILYYKKLHNRITHIFR